MWRRLRRLSVESETRDEVSASGRKEEGGFPYRQWLWRFYTAFPQKMPFYDFSGRVIE
jgi:hypothetical protein